MDADSSSSITDSDDDPSPPKTIPKRQGGSATAKNVQKSKPIPEMESSETMEMVDENTMIYRIYALPSSGASEESSNGGGLITSENLATLQAFAYNLSKDYIWHNEPFRLFRKESPTPHFVGQTNFGDNTEDEWFIVYLLYEISKNFPDYIISVLDSDGQFLLIETADYLPPWLEGDIADNRVFIFRGALHIVPLSKHLKPCPRSLSDSTMKQLLSDEPPRVFALLEEEHLIHQSLASDSIQRMILKRIEGFPERIGSQRHRANCVLPAKLAALLKDTGPFFLGAAVHLSCQKDAKKSRGFSIDFTSTDLLTTSMVFSRHLYAELSSTKEIPNFDISDWNLPKKGAMGYKANELGMKLTRGLELLCEKATTKNQDVENDNLASGSWGKFVEVLHILGYFEDAPEGSRRHDQLMKRALLYYQIQPNLSDSGNYQSTLGQSLSKTLSNLDVVNVERLRAECAPEEEDDDDWMNITPEKLETMLSNKWFGNPEAKPAATNGSPKTKSSGTVTYNGAAVANGGHPSGLSVVPKQLAQDRDGGGYSRQVGKSDRGSDVFGESVKKMLDLHIPHDGDDSSDMESYSEEISDLSLDEKEAAAAVNAFATNLKQYMHAMEKTKGGSTKPKQRKIPAKTHSKGKAGKEATTAQRSTNSPGGDSIDFEDDDFTPVDIDKKLVSNMLESYFPEACGQSSSASTLLHGDRPSGSGKGQGKKAGDK